jgi:hypothetical protein
VLRGSLFFGALGGAILQSSCEPRRPEKIEVTPAKLEFKAAGEKKAVTATVLDQNGKPLEASVKFTSSQPTVAEVDANGNVTAVKTGNAEIAAESGKNKGTATVDVRVPTKLFVRAGSLRLMSGDGPISPEAPVPTAPVIHGPGESLPFEAFVLDRLNRPITGAPMLYTFLDPLVAEVSRDGKSLVGKAFGTTVLSVVSGPVSQRLRVTVEAPGAHTIVLEQEKLTIRVGEKHQLKPELRSKSGRIEPDASFTYRSRDTRTVLVDPAGIVMGMSPGVTLVAVESGEERGVITITVRP